MSGPRNVSTALMYSFAERDDIRVVDEPLYGHYLRVTGADHPGKDEILAAMNCDGDKVIHNLLGEQDTAGARRLFLKNMAHHLVDLDLGFLSETSNVLLIRDPREMLPSLVNQVPNAQLVDTGLKRQWQLYSDLARSGVEPAVLDSRELLLDPAGVLKELCTFLGLKFHTQMLRWKSGPRPEDGIWARHWYHAVHQSTGFAPYNRKKAFPQNLRSLLAECRPWYDKLFERAIRAENSGDAK